MYKVLYMPATDLNGSWPADSASDEFREDASIFKFVVGDDGKSAVFAVHDDVAACRQALAGMRRGWMSTVCAAGMFAPASTKSIFTVKAGTADLQDDGGWKVRDKAEILFVE